MSEVAMELGGIVAVPYGTGSLTAAGRVVAEIEDRPDWWLVRMNVLGTHSVQMFAEHEMTVIAKPSDAAQLGLCPGCLGLGIVHRSVPVEMTDACSQCEGSGNLSLKVLVHADDNGVRAKVIERA